LNDLERLSEILISDRSPTAEIVVWDVWLVHQNKHGTDNKQVIDKIH